MRERRYVKVRPYLPHAVVATLAVVGLPILAVFALIGLMDPDPHFLLIAFAGLGTSVAASAAGILLWKTRPESADIAFGELLIWGWLQRKRAEDVLDEGAALLGLDRSGHPTDDVRISPERQLDVLKDLNEALEQKDPYTHGHSQRVERHAYRTAAAMGLSVADIEALRLAAVLHDVGKIRIPDRVLRKPGRLTDEERVIVEEHVVVGAWMISSVGSADVVSSVRHHHERWDGRGYPDGLANTEIPLFARIIAVADAYDAITSTRPYRASSGREHAVSVLRAEAGKQFDPMIVEAFVDALPVRLPVAGALVLLAGPAALGRKLAMWLKRFGGGQLAPAAASLGAVIALGAFMSGPAAIETPPKRNVVVEAPSSGLEAASGETKERSEPEISAPEPQPAPVVAAAPAGPRHEPDFVLGEMIVRPDRDRAEPKPGIPEPQGPPSPAPTPEPTPPSPAPEPTPAGPEPTPAADECPASDSSNGDENGNGHEKAKGEGHSKHCD